MEEVLFKEWFENNQYRLDGTTVSEAKYSIEDLQFVFQQALKLAKKDN